MPWKLATRGYRLGVRVGQRNSWWSPCVPWMDGPSFIKSKRGELHTISSDQWRQCFFRQIIKSSKNCLDFQKYGLETYQDPIVLTFFLVPQSASIHTQQTVTKSARPPNTTKHHTHIHSHFRLVPSCIREGLTSITHFFVISRSFSKTPTKGLTPLFLPRSPFELSAKDFLTFCVPLNCRLKIFNFLRSFELSAKDFLTFCAPLNCRLKIFTFFACLCSWIKLPRFNDPSSFVLMLPIVRFYWNVGYRPY